MSNFEMLFLEITSQFSQFGQSVLNGFLFPCSSVHSVSFRQNVNALLCANFLFLHLPVATLQLSASHSTFTSLCLWQAAD